MGKVIDPAGPEQQIGGIASSIVEKAGAKFIKDGERVDRWESSLLDVVQASANSHFFDRPPPV